MWTAKSIGHDEYLPGSTAPPLHPNCRSTIAGSLYGPNKKKTGTRIARNDKGKTYYVPADMTYNEWYKKYIEPTIIPTGNADWKTNEQGYVVVTKQISRSSKHYRTAPRAEPNAVIMHYGKPGPHE